jgi:hypothetical protein
MVTADCLLNQPAPVTHAPTPSPTAGWYPDAGVAIGRCINDVEAVPDAEEKDEPDKVTQAEIDGMGVSLVLAGSINILGALEITALLEMYLSPLEDDYKFRFETFAPVKLFGDFLKIEAHPDPEINEGKLGPNFEMKFGVLTPMYLKAQGRFYVFGWSANGYVELDPDAGEGVFELTDVNFGNAGFDGWIRMSYSVDKLEARVEGAWRNDPNGNSLFQAIKDGIEAGFTAIKEEADRQWKAADECDDRYWASCDSGCTSSCDDCGVFQIPDAAPCNMCALHRLDSSCDISCDEYCDRHCFAWICANWCDGSCDFFCDDCNQKTLFCEGCSSPWQGPIIGQGCDDDCILGCGPGCSEDCDDALFWGCDGGCSPNSQPWEMGVPESVATPTLWDCIESGLLAVLMEVAALALSVFNAIAQQLFSIADPQDFIDIYELDFAAIASLSDFGSTGFYWHIKYHLFKIHGGPVIESNLIFNFNSLLETAGSMAESAWDVAKAILGFRRRRDLQLEEHDEPWMGETLRAKTGFGQDWGHAKNSTVPRERRMYETMKDKSTIEHERHNQEVEEALHELIIFTLDPDEDKRNAAREWWEHKFHPNHEVGNDISPFDFDDESLDNNNE